MNRLLDACTGRRGLLWAIPVVLGSFLVVTGPTGGVMAIVPLVVLGLAAIVLALNLAGRDPSATERAALVTDAPLPRALLARWLARSRHFRFVGGTVGTIVGVGFLHNGGFPILWTLGGVAVGGALAEAHRLRRPEGAGRTAELQVRRLVDYAARTDLWAMAAIAAGAVVLSAAALARDVSGVVNLCVGAVAIVSLTLGFQQLVAVRSRPSLPTELREADDLLRRLAATQGFARPAIAVAIGLIAVAYRRSTDDAAIGPVVLVLFVLAWAWYAASWQNRKNLLAAVRP